MPGDLMIGRLRRLLSSIMVPVAITVVTYAPLTTPLPVDNAGSGGFPAASGHRGHTRIKRVSSRPQYRDPYPHPVR